MASSYGINANFGINPYPNPATVPMAHQLSDFDGPAKTVMLFEVANSKTYDITNITGVGANGYNSDEEYGGGSPSGDGLGYDYDPNGQNSEAYAGATATDGYVKYATGVLRYANTSIGMFTGPQGRHTGGANYLMADTHAKFLRPGSVTGGQSYNANGNIYYMCGGTYGGGANAATVDCGDSTIAATFNIQ